MICVTDIRIPRAALDALAKLNIKVITLPPDPALPAAVASHTDLLIFALDGKLLTRRDYYSIARREIDLICEKASLSLLLSECKASDKYPLDCSLCAKTGTDFVICRRKSSDEELLKLCSDSGRRIIDVKQGYAACACAILSDGAVITADPGIALALCSAGIEVMTVSPGSVDLPGYDTGFIGGASGLCGDTLYFVGDPTHHPDYARITEFAKLHSTRIVSLGNTPFYDVGGLFFFST